MPECPVMAACAANAEDLNKKGLVLDWVAIGTVLKPLAVLALQIVLQKLLDKDSVMRATAPTKCCPEHLACHDAAVEACCAAVAAAVAARECCCAE